LGWADKKGYGDGTWRMVRDLVQHPAGVIL